MPSEADTLRAERDALRAALEEIDGLTMSMFRNAADLAQEAKRIARKALQSTEAG